MPHHCTSPNSRSSAPATSRHAVRSRSRRAKFAALLALLPLLAGCQLWNGWLEALKWRDLDTNKPVQGPAVALDPNIKPLPGTNSSTAVALIPRVTVFRITVPVGAFSTNDKIWSQLNEDAIDSKTAVLMAQNGLRAATGVLTRWPAIAGMLDAPGAMSDQIVYQTDGHASINVVTRPNVAEQIVVSIDRDLQQQGREFERCDNGFRLSMQGIRNKPQLQVQLEPVVTLGTVAMERPGLGVTRTGFTSEESFEDLRMAATLTADQFLVVAAMDPKTSPFSVGTQWLSDHDKAPATETVLVFVPTPNTPAKPK